MLRRKILWCILALFATFRVNAQEKDSAQVDIIDLLLGAKRAQTVDQVRSDKKVHFSMLPSAVNVPGGGRAVVTAINAAFFLGDPSKTNLSNVYLLPYTNFSNRYGFYVRPNLWSSGNRYNLIGDYRIAHFPQYSWGTGGDTPEWDESLIDSDYLRIHQTFLARIVNKWYAGPGYALDHHYNVEESEAEGPGHLERYGEETSSTVSSGFTFNIVYDARINAINPPRGAYLLTSYRMNNKSLGSSFNNHALVLDGRKYIPLSSERTHILALRTYYWTVLGGRVPYLDLPATNWIPNTGMSSRGFQTGRYRSNAMVYGEAEQRYQLAQNGLVGFVTFFNIASASELDTQHFRTWHVGAGAGLRLKLNKYSDTNVLLDFGFSANYWSVWVNIGEAF